MLNSRLPILPLNAEGRARAAWKPVRRLCRTSTQIIDSLICLIPHLTNRLNDLIASSGSGGNNDVCDGDGQSGA